MNHDPDGGTLSGLSQEIDAIRQAASDVYNMGYRLGGPGTGQGGVSSGWIERSNDAWDQAIKSYARDRPHTWSRMTEWPQPAVRRGAGTQGDGGYWILVKYLDPANNNMGNTIWVPVAAGSGPGAGSAPATVVPADTRPGSTHTGDTEATAWTQESAPNVRPPGRGVRGAI